MALVWNITCGSCGRNVAAEIVSGWAANQPLANAGTATLWLKCPACGEGSVKVRQGPIVYPLAPVGRNVSGLPEDVKKAWHEARVAHAVGAYTAAEIMCRKILMHLAVDKAGSKPGGQFVGYVDDLEKAGYITTGLKAVVDQVRKRGNIANHELPSSGEAESVTTLKITEHLLDAIYELPGLAAGQMPAPGL
jgi:hypothetical protein